MNHGIARIMDLSIGLDVTSKSGGGGGGGSQKSFPSHSLFCGLFQTPSQSLKSIFLLQFFPFLNPSLPEFFSTLKSRKRTTLFYGKFNPLQSIQSRKRGLIQQCIPIGLLSGSTPRPRQNKTKELSGIHKLSLFYFRSNFSWEGGGGASNLGWSRYLFVSPIRVWFQVVQNPCHHKKKKKKWCTVLLASILLCDEDVTLALPCVGVPPCTLPSQRWLKLFQEISNRKSGYEQNSLLICNGFPFFYPFLYAKQGWRFDDKAHLLGFGFDYHIQCQVFIQPGLSAPRVPADFSSLSNFPWYLPLPLFFTPNPPPPKKKKMQYNRPQCTKAFKWVPELFHVTFVK